MVINKSELKDNLKFILITVVLVLFFAVLSFVKENNTEISESELPSGEETYKKLVINEYSSNNKLISPDGNAYDWIELYNGNNKDINLTGYGLSDSNNKIKWVFPNVTIEKKSYLIIYLKGSTEEGLYAPFKLKSSGGEEITLTKPNGKVIDAVKTVPLSKGQSAARDLNGNFIITTPTPNFANTKEGYENLLNSLKVTNNELQINEILPRNDGNFMINNKFYGYVEIKNISDHDIDLDNYYLSDDIDTLYKYKIPRRTLKKDELLVIYMGNSTDTERLYSSFELDKKDGEVYLSTINGIVDSVDYEDVPNGFALVRNDNKFNKTTIISPGYENTNEGVEQFYNSFTKKTLLINEVMNHNSKYLAQNGYKFYDWIELYNNSSETINLKDYSLTNSFKGTKYNLPEVLMEPNSYYVVMLSGDSNLSGRYTHLDFKISDSEALYLFKNDKVVDSMVVSNIPINYSFGRFNGVYGYISTPSPLEKNNTGVIDISKTPEVSLKSGIYDNEVSIKIDGIGNIYYTLDGTNPSIYSNKYEDEIKLTKTSVLKVASIEENKLKSNIVTSSYIINENHTLPVLSMTTSPYDYNRMISNPYSEIEIPGTLELYEEDGGFKIPCSVSLFGGSARGLAKKSYGIRFKGEYGASELVYNLFDNRETKVYESIVLRSGSQDYSKAFMRDILGTSLMDDYTDVDVQSYKTVVLYINGEYYGLYNIREKVNKDFIANHYNVDPDKLNMIQGANELKYGTRDFYNKVLNFVLSHDMTNEENYEKVKEMLDVTNYIDFFIGELYTTNNDIVNIRYFSHPDIDNGKMKMIFFDLDYAFINYAHDYYYFLINPEGMQEGFNIDNRILIELFKNKQFKLDFLKRLSYNLNNTWKEENVINRFNEIYENIYPEIERNQKRWGLSVNTFIEETNKLKNYIEKRNKYLLRYTKRFFDLSDSEYDRYFGDVLWNIVMN